MLLDGVKWTLGDSAEAGDSCESAMSLLSLATCVCYRPSLWCPSTYLCQTCYLCDQGSSYSTFYDLKGGFLCSFSSWSMLCSTWLGFLAWPQEHKGCSSVGLHLCEVKRERKAVNSCVVWLLQLQEQPCKLWRNTFWKFAVEILWSQTNLLSFFFLKLHFPFLTVLGTLSWRGFTVDVNVPDAAMTCLCMYVLFCSQPKQADHITDLFGNKQSYFSGVWSSSVHCDLISGASNGGCVQLGSHFWQKPS